MTKTTKKFAVETIGCRLNQYETEKMSEQLVRLGLERVDFTENADLYLINTCTVTGRADASCRNIISRAARNQKNPAVVVVGCYVDADEEKVAHLNGVDLVVKNSDKENIAGIIKHRFPELISAKIPASHTKSLEMFHYHSRAWIKISDGCNQRCAYCIIPHVRGKLTNRPAGEILDEVRLLADNGYNEVVLTGVHIGQYRSDKVKSIADLVKYLIDNTDLARLRLSSIEPQEVNGKLVQAMKKAGRRVCRHLHIPLQSGSDRILKIMHRPYDTKRYLENIQRVKDNIEGVIIGADTIVGFPGETDDDFAGSIRMAESGYLDYLHVFSYSDRPGTESADMPDKIYPGVIKERNKILREISVKNYKAALKREVGNIASVIPEDRSEKAQKKYFGITDNYLKIEIPERLNGRRDIVELKVTSARDKYLIGNF